MPVKGPEQSNQIAELWAVVIVLHWAWAPTHIVTDSKWVMDGVLKLQAQPDTSVIKWEHHTLWVLVGGALRAIHHDFFAISWTQGHAKQKHIDQGLSTLEDQRGNEEADKLATKGAYQHAVPQQTIDTLHRHYARTTMWQAMQLAILQARYNHDVVKKDHSKAHVPCRRRGSPTRPYGGYH